MKDKTLYSDIITNLKKFVNKNSLYVHAYPLISNNFPFVISIKCEKDNVKFYGHGTSYNKDEASLIAIIELIERLYMYYGGNTSTLKKNSNGFAAHLKKNIAIDNSVNELIERHTILKAMALSIRPKKICCYYNNYNIFGKENNIDFFYWIGPLNKYVTVARLQHGYKTMYGLGSSHKLENSINKAFFEIIPKFIISKTQYGQAFIDIFGSSHFKYHWNNKTPETDNFFENQSKFTPVIDSYMTPNDFTSQQILQPNHLLINNRIYVFKSYSNKIQELFNGKWEYEKIGRLNIDKSIKLPSELHIIG